MREAKSLRAVGGTDDGGPVVMPRALASTWWGIFDETGENTTDDNHAALISTLDGVGVVKHAGAQLLGRGDDAGAFFHPTSTGGLLVSWGGAESIAGCLAAANNIPEKEWKKTKLRCNVTDPALVMFGYSLDGRRLKKSDQVEFRLARATYRIDVCNGFEATVRVGKRNEATEISVIRLTR